MTAALTFPVQQDGIQATDDNGSALVPKGLTVGTITIDSTRPYVVHTRSELDALFGQGRYPDITFPVTLYGILARRARAAGVALADHVTGHAEREAADQLDELEATLRRDARPPPPGTVFNVDHDRIKKHLERRAGTGGKAKP